MIFVEYNMRINMKAIGFSMTPAIQKHIETQVESALSRVARGVKSVSVRVDDINAARGGIDKRCTMIIHRSGAPIVAEAVDADLYLAVSEAARKARRAAQRETSRQLSLERKDSQRPGVFVLMS